jgi:hypothetical protein
MDELQQSEQFEILSVAEARRALTNDDDIRSDVAFQHDVNRLLATLEDICGDRDVSPGA